MDGVYDPQADHAYTEYLYIWKNMLNSYFLPAAAANDPLPFFQSIFDQILNSWLNIMKKLNLSLHNDPSRSEDDIVDLVPVKPKDLELFMNLSEFLMAFLTNTLDSVDYFSKWLPVIGKCLIELSCQNPNISGYQKIISKSLLFARRFGFSFDHDPSLKRVFEIYCLELIAKIPSLKDDLMASCVGVIINASAMHLVSKDAFVNSLIVALRMGTSYLPLANIAISVLEDAVDSGDGQEMMKVVLPELEPYICTLLDEVGSVSIKPKKAKKSTVITAEDELDKEMLRMKVLRFLGRLHGENQLILGNIFDFSSQMDESFMAWDPVKKLNLKLPVKGRRMDLFIDELLPLISSLALSSTIRKVKVNAAELLHALVLNIIGNHVHRIKEGSGVVGFD